MMRMMMGNIHASMEYLLMFIEAPLKRVSRPRNMYEEVLENYFGTLIPTPFGITHYSKRLSQR